MAYGRKKARKAPGASKPRRTGRVRGNRASDKRVRAARRGR